MVFAHCNKDKVFVWINYVGIAAALAYGMYLRWKLFMADRSLWLDAAALAVDVIKYPYAGLFQPLASDQSAPAGFLIITKWIGSIYHYNETALLLVPLLFGVAAMALFTLVSIHLLGNKKAFIAVTIFSLSSSAIYYSAEYKQYSGDLFFAVLLILLAWLTITHGFAKRYCISLGVAGLMAIWFSHTAVFMIAGVSVGLVYAAYHTAQPAISKKVIVLLALWLVYYLTVFFLIIYPSIPPAMYTYHASGFAPFPITSLDDVRWYSHLALVIKQPLGFNRFFLELPFVCMVVGFMVLLHKKNRTMGLMLLTPLFFLLMASLFKKYPIMAGNQEVYARFILFTVPILSIAIAEGAWHFIRDKSFFVYGVCIGILLLPLFFLRHTSYPKEETRPLVHYLIAHTVPSDTIYVYKKTIPAFQYYTRTQPLEYIAGNYYTDGQKYVDELAALPKTGRYWLLFSHDAKLAEKALLKYLDTHAKKIEAQKTEGAALYLYHY